MKVKVRCLGPNKSEIAARQHWLVTDQPLDPDATDAGMTPPELFLSALGGCAASYASEYLRVRALPDEGLEIRLSASKGDQPLRITHLRIEVVAPGLTQRHRNGILRAVDAGLLKNTLNKPPVMEVKVVSAAEAVEPELAAV
jgi:putative redox protein